MSFAIPWTPRRHFQIIHSVYSTLQNPKIFNLQLYKTEKKPIVIFKKLEPECLAFFPEKRLINQPFHFSVVVYLCFSTDE